MKMNEQEAGGHHTAGQVQDRAITGWGVREHSRQTSGLEEVVTRRCP